jgi:hypothetical protein
MKFLDGFKMLPLQMKYAMNLEQHTSADYDTKATLLSDFGTPQYGGFPFQT